MTRSDEHWVKPEACGTGGVVDDRELWACALAVERQYGDGAPVHIAERIGELALQGDLEGVEAWKRIAARFDRLQRHKGA